MPELSDQLRRLLDHFETHLNLDHVELLRARHRALLQGETLDPPPLTCYVPYEGTDHTPYPVREIIDNPQKMLVNELLIGFTSLFHTLERRDDTPYVIRANLGTGIIASMFGAKIEVLDDNPPWAYPLGDDRDIERLVNEPLPEVTAGLGRQMFEHYTFFKEVLAGYPRCQAAFEITLPDLQGPFDVAEILWGSEIYLAIKLQPELVRQLLDRTTKQILRTARALKSYVSDSLQPLGNYQHATAVKGQILMRNDSIVLISPETYAEVLKPYDTQIAEELGAAIHFCGDGYHQVDNVLSVAGLQGLDFGQPEMMDSDAIYEKTAAQGIPIARMNVPREQLVNGTARERFPKLVNFRYSAQNVADAQQVCSAYYH
ncbi:hypothetical protein [Poriferisphaera sp. WC338]|uniref:hypothetical protein n=1 Tax=Poriferisphaera sp. WC338 TaxID=3425129 RepID=UPI003D8192AA